jgi:hypothetical protein
LKIENSHSKIEIQMTDEVRDSIDLPDFPKSIITTPDPVTINGMVLRTFSESNPVKPKYDQRAKSVLLKTYHYKTIQNDTIQSPEFCQELENKKIKNLLDF